MHSKTVFRCSGSSPFHSILNGEERSATPAAVYLREDPVLDGIVLRTIRRIMHNEDIHTQSVGKVHEILLDNPVRTGVRTASVAENHHGMGIWVLLHKMFVPYPRDVVADKLGSVVVGTECQIAHILRDIVDAVWNYLSISERLKVVVKRLGLPDAKRTSLSLEVTDEFLLLCVDAQDGEPQLCTLLPDVSNMQKLNISLLGIPHRKALEELPVAEAKGLKYLTNMVFGDVASVVNHSTSYLWDGQRYPEYILVLRESGKVRFDDQTEYIHPFWMKWQLGLTASAGAADPSLFGSVPGAEFFDALTDGIFAVSHFFANFANAMSAKCERTFREVVPHLAFIEFRHKHPALGRKAFWRSFLNHFKGLAIFFKVKKFSPDFLYYIINNQQIESKFSYFFKRFIKACSRSFRDIVFDPDFRLATA